MKSMDSDTDFEENKVDDASPDNKFLKIKSKFDPSKEYSPVIKKDSNRKVNVMDDMFNTSGVFAKSKKKCHKKKSKFWGADELMALMGSVSNFNKEPNDQL